MGEEIATAGVGATASHSLPLSNMAPGLSAPPSLTGGGFGTIYPSSADNSFDSACLNNSYDGGGRLGGSFDSRMNTSFDAARMNNSFDGLFGGNSIDSLGDGIGKGSVDGNQFGGSVGSFDGDALGPQNSVLSSGAFPKTANFLTQLEGMMGVVKREATALEGMKARLREMQELQARYAEERNRAEILATENAELHRQNHEQRQDMQRLNDIYHTERNSLLEAQANATRAEQERAALALEKDFFMQESQRIPELKRTAKAAKTAAAEATAALEIERSSAAKAAADAAQRINSLEASKADLTQQLWALTEQLHTQQSAAAENEERWAHHLNIMNSEAARRVQMAEGDGMAAADWEGKFFRLLNHWQQTYTQLSEQIYTMQNAGAVAHAESASLRESADRIRSEYHRDLSALQSQVAELTNQLQDVSNQRANENLELTRTREALAVKSMEAARFHEELVLARDAIAGTETRVRSELESTLMSALSQRDGSRLEVEALSKQVEKLESQLHTDTEKHIEALREIRATESALAEEAEALSAELEDKTRALRVAEAEVKRLSELVQAGVTENAGLVTTLRSELEKRVAELLRVRSDADVAIAARDEAIANATNIKEELQRNEAHFRRALETERGRLKGNLSLQNQRIAGLESEKAELLNELSDSVRQYQDAQRALDKAKKATEEATLNSTLAREEADAAIQRNEALLRELEESRGALRQRDAKIDELTAIIRRESHEREAALSDARRAAASQATESASHAQSLLDEVEALKKALSASEETERRLEADRRKLREELNAANENIHTAAESAASEATAALREAIESRNKLKLFASTRAKLEGDLLAAEAEIARLAEEVNRRGELLKANEGAIIAANERTTAAKLAAENESLARQTLVGKVAELESVLRQKASATENLSEELARVEREGMAELRRLRANLAHAEAEISELTPICERLSQELADAKVALSRANSSATGRQSALLEELRIAEEALARERRQRSAEVEDGRSRVRELEVSLEKLRAEMEDANARLRQEKQAREMRVAQSDAEGEKLRSLLRERETQLEELETTAQANRRKQADLKERTESLEQEIADLRSRLETEQATRRRLETRIRSLNATEDPLRSSNSSFRTKLRGEVVDEGLSLISPPTMGATTSSYSSRMSPQYGDASVVTNIDDLLQPSQFSSAPMENVDSSLRNSQSAPSLPSVQPIIGDEDIPKSSPRNSTQKSAEVSSPVASRLAIPFSPADRVSAALSLRLAQQKRSVPDTTGSITSSSVTSLARSPQREAATEEEPSSGSTVVDEMIRRTQAALNRRLQGRTTDSTDTLSSLPIPVSDSDIDTTKPTSGRASRALAESIQQAHELYGSTNSPDALQAPTFEEELSPTDTSFQIPKLAPPQPSDYAPDEDLPPELAVLAATTKKKKKKRVTKEGAVQLPKVSSR